MLIDTHTHLYLKQFDDDRKLVVKRAVEAGVEKMFLPNIDSGTFSSMHEMQDRFPGICYAMAGIHPGSVKEDYKAELDRLVKELENDRYIAIGETGIDLYWDKTFRKEQEDSFVYHIKLAIERDLPLVIHARESFREIFDLLDRHMDEGLKGVFHSFTGGKEEVDRIMEYGFYFGINGIVSFKNAGLDKTVSKIPVDRILLETDSPFLAPVPKRGKRNESGYLNYIASKVAVIYEMTVGQIAGITTRNALTLFSKAH